MTFDPADVRTWPLWLYSDQMIQIYPHYRTKGGLELAARRKRFEPGPDKVRPMRWRRSAVIADVEGPVAGVVRLRMSAR